MNKTSKTIESKTNSNKSDIVLKVNDVSKKYRLYGSHFHRLKEIFHPLKKKYHKEFWALKNISFEIRKGETIGIIGRNGSGKSTILQIISGILTPTGGEIKVKGKISALLELGTGFNPELTGRENVYINGSIMGFSKTDIDQQFKSIEEFADIGEFIDQPVKIYSSGMFVRLAFAAAINVDPDILIVDEALAVGDAKFQNKCYNKFNEFKKQGKTIIFVSHDMDSITKHCDRAILFENGSILDAGATSKITCFYYDLLFTGSVKDFSTVPILLEEDFLGYNLVHYKKDYIAILISLDKINLLEHNLEELCLRHKDKIIISDSIEDLKEQLQSSAPVAQEVVQSTESELETFLNSYQPSDTCSCKPGYNKYEHRIGSQKAEIVDFMIVSEGRCSPSVIKTGSKVDIYYKVLAHSYINTPIFGFIVKDVNGIPIYGTNTTYCNTSIESIPEGECIIFKFSMNFNLNYGDYFITLGIGENEQVQVDTRYDMIHINIARNHIFEGIIELPDFQCNVVKALNLKGKKA